MVNIQIRIDGIEQAIATLNNYRLGITGLNRVIAKWGTDKIYGPGIETGKTLSGGVARRAGAARFIYKGLQAVKEAAPHVIATNVYKGAAGASHISKELTDLGIKVSKQEVPKVSRELEGSIRRFGF
jgi:hypothetical protein